MNSHNKPALKNNPVPLNPNINNIHQKNKNSVPSETTADIQSKNDHLQHEQLLPTIV